MTRRTSPLDSFIPWRFSWMSASSATCVAVTSVRYAIGLLYNMHESDVAPMIAL